MTPRKRLMAAALACAFAGALVGTAQAAPKRGDATKPVYLVHGYGSAKNCTTGWAPAISTLRRSGWTGTSRTVAYYSGDRGCNTRLGSYSRDTSIRELGRRLAWDIYTRYSRHGKKVDVVGHSMGGLIARVALAGVRNRWAGFPRYVYVEDAVTVGTPHQGVTASWADHCKDRQCRQMKPGSTFLIALQRDTNQDPQGRGGTDWTLIGSHDDETVASYSALYMKASHKVVYDVDQGLSHRALITTSAHDHEYHLAYANDWQHFTWHMSTKGRSPLNVVYNAIAHPVKW